MSDAEHAPYPHVDSPDLPGIERRILDRVVREQDTQREVQKLREIVREERGFEGLLGTSAPMPDRKLSAVSL